MYKVKLFSTSRENDDFLEFLEKNKNLKGEEDDEVLGLYMNAWFAENKNIEIVEASHPIWAENHLFYFVLYKTLAGSVSRRRSKSETW